MCGNPRKYFGQLTRQEVSASLSEDLPSANWSSNLKPFGPLLKQISLEEFSLRNPKFEINPVPPSA